MHHYLPNTTIFAMSWKQRPPKCWVSDWLTFWLADFLTCWLSYWLIGWLTDWLTGRHVNRLIDWHYLLTKILVNWLADWLNYWRADLLKLIDWQSHTDQLIMIAGSLTNWLDWLADILRFILRKEWRLLIVNRDYWLLMKMVNFSF